MPEGARVLVAGIGNIFLGDDGFGVEVANRMRRHLLPEGVRVADFGIRGLHLAYELLEGYDALVLVDAVPMDAAPGTVAVIEPEIDPPDDDASVVRTIEAHSMTPAVVLRMLRTLGGQIARVVIIGCQPERLDEGIGLSASVAAAIDPAILALEEVIAEMTAPVSSDGKAASR